MPQSMFSQPFVRLAIAVGVGWIVLSGVISMWLAGLSPGVQVWDLLWRVMGVAPLPACLLVGVALIMARVAPNGGQTIISDLIRITLLVALTGGMISYLVFDRFAAISDFEAGGFCVGSDYQRCFV